MNIETFDSLAIGARVVMLGGNQYPELIGKHGSVVAVHHGAFVCDIALDNDRLVTVTADAIALEQMNPLIVPTKFIRKNVKGTPLQRWHIIAREGEEQLAPQFPVVHWWSCGCGKTMSDSEMNPLNRSNADKISFEVVDIASDDVKIDAVFVCASCWPYRIRERHAPEE